jgi:Icc-related predicted phosphoesterase
MAQGKRIDADTTIGNIMRIVSIEESPFHLLPYRNVSGDRRIVRATLPFLRAKVDALPNGLDAIMATADLQGREFPTNQSANGRLLGEHLAEHCELLAETGVFPTLDKVGVILSGDLYARELLDKRGGSGDIRQVWAAFAQRFRWVAGVAGNHDFFGKSPSVPDFKAFLRQPKTHFLDGHVVELDGLKIGGLSGVVGDSTRKLFRREENAFASEIKRLVGAPLDLLVMHDGPDAGDTKRGWPSMREALERSRPILVIRGHAHWESPLATLQNGTQVLNVDSRVVVITAA